MTRTLLSVAVGAPVALLAMALWFFVEVCGVTGRRRPMLLVPAAALTTVVLVALVVARFVEYA